MSSLAAELGTRYVARVHHGVAGQRAAVLLRVTVSSRTLRDLLMHSRPMIPDVRHARVTGLWVVLTGLYSLNRILFINNHNISGLLCAVVMHFLLVGGSFDLEQCQDEPYS